MLDVGPLLRKSCHLTDGLLILVLLGAIATSSFTFFGARDKLRKRDVFLVALLTPTAVTIFKWHPSLSPDVAVFILGIVLSIELLQLLEEPAATRPEFEYSVFHVAVLATIGVTVKLSFLGFAMGTFLVIWIAMLAQRRNGDAFSHRRTLLWIAIGVGVVLLPWAVRGVIISGYPVYPSTFGGVPLEWAVPRETVTELGNVVKAWARQPNAQSAEVLRSWSWLGPWFWRLLRLGHRNPGRRCCPSLMLWRAATSRSRSGQSLRRAT